MIQLKKLFKISNIRDYAVRYFTMNSFDGIITILGILIATFLSGIVEKKVIITSCLGAAIAIMLSGMWITYETEKAERKRLLKKFEHIMGIKAKKELKKAHSIASLLLALIDGLSPLVITLIIILPLFLFPLPLAYYLSFFFSALLLFLLGLLLGRIAKENMLISGIKLLFIGIVCFLLLSLLKQIGLLR